MQSKHVTINIGPQDSESWLFVSFAAVIITFIIGMSGHAMANDVEIERIKAQAHAYSVEPVK